MPPVSQHEPFTYGGPGNIGMANGMKAPAVPNRCPRTPVKAHTPRPPLTPSIEIPPSSPPSPRAGKIRSASVCGSPRTSITYSSSQSCRERSPSLTCKKTLSLEDLIEGGFSREVVADRVLSPSPRKRWQYFVLKRSIDKKSFHLNTREGNKFVLCAKRVGDVFYISQYETFPWASGENSSRYCCTVSLDKTRKNVTKAEAAASKCRTYRKYFLLRSRSCEYCDNVLKKFNCGNHEKPASDSGLDRQILAKISHSTVCIKGTQIDARSVKMSIPPSERFGDELVRHGWCPRIPCQDSETVKFDSQLPVWSTHHNTLTMEFLHSHITVRVCHCHMRHCTCHSHMSRANINMCLERSVQFHVFEKQLRI